MALLILLNNTLCLMNTRVLVWLLYSTAQFKLDRTCVQHGLDKTRFFISHTCKHVCACKIDDVKPSVHSTCVRTRPVHDANQECTCQIWITCARKL